MTRVKPLIAWPGGKGRLLNELLPLIPAHHCYVEAFAGGLAVLLAKNPSRVEVVNDINSDLIALYRCAKYHRTALLHELQWMPYSRQELSLYLTQKGSTDLQRAARFFIRQLSSFAGSGSSFGVTKTRALGISRAEMETRLEALEARLARVTIECVSYERLLALYDAPESFFFFDPPYLATKPAAYAGWSEEDMSAFAAHIAELRGSWLLTVDDSPYNRELFKDYSIRSLRTPNQREKNRGSGQARTFGELVITRA